MAEKILVTGGAGYIGSHCVLELVQAGYVPVVIDNFHNAIRGTERLPPFPCEGLGPSQPVLGVLKLPQRLAPFPVPRGGRTPREPAAGAAAPAPAHPVPGGGHHRWGSAAGALQQGESKSPKEGLGGFVLGLGARSWAGKRVLRRCREQQRFLLAMEMTRAGEACGCFLPGAPAS